jgi:hypothetical protein
VRRGSKTLVATLTALLLAAGLLACGGDDDGSSTTAVQRESPQNGPGGSSGGADRGNGTGTTPATSGKGEAGSKGDSTGDFVPRQHEDSGGGAEQFRVKGGDNSVQEFGAEAEPSKFEAAAQALHNFLDARAAGDWDAACEYMSRATVASFEQIAARGEQGSSATCGEIVEGLINPNAKQALKEEAEKADVGSLRVDGEQAFLIYTGTESTVLAMPMANEGGEWKVASLAGTPLN